MITDIYIDEGRTDRSAGLSFVLRPNVSLSVRGFSILIICFAAISLFAGGFFWALGAWPVFGFFGLDVILLYVFFKLNYRQARRHEKIELNNDRLTVTQVSANGLERSWHFNPYWVNILKFQAKIHELNFFDRSCSKSCFSSFIPIGTLYKNLRPTLLVKIHRKLTPKIRTFKISSTVHPIL